MTGKACVRVLILGLLLLVISSVAAFAVGKYCLAYWREMGFYEKDGNQGNHIVSIHLFNESGNAVTGKTIYTSTGRLLGTTDSKGQLEYVIQTSDQDCNVEVHDGTNLTDTTPIFLTSRICDWGHYCWDVGFLYKSDSGNSGVFDLNYDGVLNSTAEVSCGLSAPRTKSVTMYYSTLPDPGQYCSDNRTWGSYYSTVGQTFKATANRIVGCKFHLLGGSSFQYQVTIRANGPGGTIIGTMTSPTTGDYEYYKTFTAAGVNAIQLTVGNTYYAEISKVGGGNLSAWHVTTNNYADGTLYEGGSAVSSYDIEGVLVGMNYTASTGGIAGSVKTTGGSGIQGATVTATPGDYSATTDASGNYTLANIPAQTYTVTASKAGYTTGTQTGKTVTSGQTLTVNFTLTATTPGAIAGSVKNGGGAGLVGATVTTDPGNYSAVTDSGGNYTISSVPPGTNYTVTASKAGYNSSTQTGKTVTSGQTTTVNFTLTVQGGTFSGIANGNFEGGFYNDPDVDHKSGTSWHRFYTAGTSKAGGDYGVYRSTHNSQSIYESSWTAGVYQQATNATVGNKYTASVYARGTDSNIKCWIGINPSGGTDPLSADILWSSESVPGTTWTQISKQITATGTTITIFLKAQNIAGSNKYAYFDDAAATDDGSATTGLITGFVKSNGGTPVSGATVATTSGGYSTTTSADGEYTLQNVSPATYNVTASKTGYNTGTNSNVTVVAGQATTSNFTITRQTGTIAGNVKNTSAQNLSGATVYTNTGGYSATTDANGNYTISSVATGTYDVSASKSGYQTGTQTGQTVNNNQTTTVNFTLSTQANPFSGVLYGSFENGFVNDPDADHKVGTSWHRYSISGGSKSGGDYNNYHSSHYGQAFWESTWTAGIYQQGTYATSGQNYTASVWVKGGDYDLKFWVGVDPTGGTNASSSNVQWSDQYAPGTAWTQISKTATASNSTITMFIKAQNVAGTNKNAFMDDASFTGP